jgi:hypothetical protein
MISRKLENQKFRESMKIGSGLLGVNYLYPFGRYVSLTRELKISKG